jgi:hypothetical protein
MEGNLDNMDGSAQPGDPAPQGQPGTMATGGSIEDISHDRRIREDRADALGRPEERAGRNDGQRRSPEVPDARESELTRRIRLMYLISPRSEYRLLAQPQRVAFRDMGRRLITEHDDPTVVRGMLDVAQHKGWQRINLTGSETFRRLAWLEARARGLETIGYAPSLEDRQRIEEWRAERGGPIPSRVRPPSSGPTGGDAARAGRLQEGQSANSRDRDGQMPQATVRKNAVDDRDAVVLAVAEEVLLKRQVGEATRARVAAAIARRLAALREQGTSVSVRMYDTAVQPSHERPVEVSRSRAQSARSR